MPTKKRRVGFIPRSDVLDLINKLSYESNLSYSKIINILVEEALCKRGLFNSEKVVVFGEDNNHNLDNTNQETKNIINQKFNYNFKNKLLKDKNLQVKEVKNEPFDDEIYAKFLIFLQFQERMKKSEA